MLRRSERIVANKSEADWVAVVVQNTSSSSNDSQKLDSQHEAGTGRDIDDFDHDFDHDYDTFEDEDPEVDESDKEDSDFCSSQCHFFCPFADNSLTKIFLVLPETPAKSPLKKRTKLTTSSSSMMKSNAKQKKSLSRLPSMPLDILFEVCSSFLHVRNSTYIHIHQ